MDQLMSRGGFLRGRRRAVHPGERKPEVWKAIVEENQGQFCRFPFVRMLRAV